MFDAIAEDFTNRGLWLQVCGRSNQVVVLARELPVGRGVQINPIAASEAQGDQRNEAPRCSRHALPSVQSIKTVSPIMPATITEAGT